ncbi:MAG: carbamate kinase [Candidatus Parcubacteria bacterium]|nr:carbamate kinase [Candidatus Parcubacteria bacterium]
MAKKKRIIIALGGNAIQLKGEKGTHEESLANVRATMQAITPIALAKNYEVIITHGNGPQVGNLLIQNAAGKSDVPEMPLFLCDAMSQGEIGYWMEQSLGDFFDAKGSKKHIVTVLTQVVVKKNDPAFKNPSKPVGPFYSKEESEKIQTESGFFFKEDAGRGFRRVVPSPEPVDVVETDVIRDLIKSGHIVVAGGGGGIPVIWKGKRLEGVDAVIDKDKTTALLGDLLKADLFVILTAIEEVRLNFGKPNEEKLGTITLKEAKKYLKDGHFAEGSMKPKIEAAIKFLAGGNKRKVLITTAEALTKALEGDAGTTISC